MPLVFSINLPIDIELSWFCGYISSGKFQLNKAFTEYCADLVVPLDADEFPVSENNESPRRFLNTLINSKSCYLQRWRIFSPPLNSNEEDIFTEKPFMLFQWENTFDVTKGYFSKVIIPREAWRTYNLALSDGCHSVNVQEGTPPPNISMIDSEQLYLAHFPIRSAGQLAEKAIVKTLKRRSNANDPTCNGFHLKKIFDLLCDGLIIDKDFIMRECQYYSLSDRKTKVTPITTSYFKEHAASIITRYPIKCQSVLTCILNKAGEVALHCADFERQLIFARNEMQAQKDDFEKKMQYLNNENARLLEQHQTEILTLKSSRSFRIGRMITWLPRVLRDYLKA